VKLRVTGPRLRSGWTADRQRITAPRTSWGRELASHPIIVDAVEELADGPVRIWERLVLRKEPRSDAYVSWHQDSAYRTIGADDLSPPGSH